MTQTDSIHTMRALLEQVVAHLSLQPDDSPVHNVEGYNDGLRVIVHKQRRRTGRPYTVCVYALPWARGWSIFATPDPPSTPQGCYNWRDVPSRYAALGKALYSPRDNPGPHHVPAQAIAYAISNAVERLRPYAVATPAQPTAYTAQHASANRPSEGMLLQAV